MNEIIIWTIIILLLVIILLLTFALVLVVKKATYLCKKERDFVVYTIDIYTDYADELDLIHIEEHEVIVKELNKIKNKLNKNKLNKNE